MAPLAAPPAGERALTPVLDDDAALTESEATTSDKDSFFLLPAPPPMREESAGLDEEAAVVIAVVVILAPTVAPVFTAPLSVEGTSKPSEDAVMAGIADVEAAFSATLDAVLRVISVESMDEDEEVRATERDAPARGREREVPRALFPFTLLSSRCSLPALVSGFGRGVIPPPAPFLSPLSRLAKPSSRLLLPSPSLPPSSSPLLRRVANDPIPREERRCCR